MQQTVSVEDRINETDNNGVTNSLTSASWNQSKGYTKPQRLSLTCNDLPSDTRISMESIIIASEKQCGNPTDFLGQ